MDTNKKTTTKHVTSWWLNHPSEKYARQIGSFSPIFGVKIKNPKILETTTQVNNLEYEGYPGIPGSLSKSFKVKVGGVFFH